MEPNFCCAYFFIFGTIVTDIVLSSFTSRRSEICRRIQLFCLLNSIGTHDEQLLYGRFTSFTGSHILYFVHWINYSLKAFLTFELYFKIETRATTNKKTTRVTNNLSKFMTFDLLPVLRDICYIQQ